MLRNANRSGRAAEAGFRSRYLPLRIASSWLLSVMLLILAALPTGLLRADDGGAIDHAVKATFLYRFIDYTEWPYDAVRAPWDPVTVGVLGDAHLATALERGAAESRATGPRVAVVRVRGGEPLDSLQVLFIDRTHPNRRSELWRASQLRGLLVVTNWEGALDQGAAINLVLREGRARFEVSMPAAERAGLRFNARMLSVAAEVRSDRR